MKIEPNNIYCGDSYKLIKEIPDRSIDLVYVDIPYLMQTGGGGSSKLAQRIINEQNDLGNRSVLKSLELRAKKEKENMLNSTDEYERKKWEKSYWITQNKINLNKANIVDGIDYSILDELVRVMKNIYIYMVQ